MSMFKMPRALQTLGSCLVMFVLALGWSPPTVAQMRNEIVNANGRWTGEIRFALANQEDVTCKISVSLKNYELRDSFNCYGLWWLPPGRSWSINGMVKADGSLVATKVAWGYVSYAALQGDLRKSSGPAGGPEFDLLATNPGSVEVSLVLKPETGATQEGKPIDDSDGVDGGEVKTAAGDHDGIYSGKKHCSGSSAGVFVMRVKAMVQGTQAKVEITRGGGGSYLRYNFSQDLGEHGTIEYELPGATILTLRLYDDPPLAEDIDGCEIELEKQALK